MAVTQTFTDKSGRSNPNAYRHIRIDHYEHKKFVNFRLDSYSSKAFYEEHEHNPRPDDKLERPKRFVLNALKENDVDANPIFDQYLGSLSQSGKDLMGQLYAYLKNETTELVGAVDIL